MTTPHLDHDVPGDRYDVYDLAYLAGGEPRVVDTALVALVESGHVRVHLPGQLAVVDQVRRHPVEGAVLDAIGTLGHRSADVVAWRLTGDDRIVAIGRRLVSDGLLSRLTVLRRRRGAPPRTLAGRQVLRALAARPPAAPAHDGSSAVVVALHGRHRMPDDRLRAAIFELPVIRSTTPSPAGLRKRISAAREGGYHPGGPVGGGGGAGA